MYRVSIAILLLILLAQTAKCRSLHSRTRRHSDRIVSVYDRNCFFSPMGCHFMQGRRAMTFITPKEFEAQRRLSRSMGLNK